MQAPLVMHIARWKAPLKYGILRVLENVVLVPFRELKFLVLTRRGVSSVTPPSVKQRIVRALLKLHPPGTSFIAAGSYLADAVAAVRGLGHPVISIERDAAVYALVQDRFRHDPDVLLVRGDSIDELSKVLGRLNRPAVLWLDGHSSGETAAHCRSDHPVLLCLAELREHIVRSHSLLIGDAATFDGRQLRPDLVQILLAVRAINPDYRIKIQGDIIVATVDRTISFHCGWRVHLSPRSESSRMASPSIANHQQPSPNRIIG